MSTLKYKATERYAMGWTDPRGVSPLGRINLNNGNPTKLDGVPAEVLRDLWMAQFGTRVVPHDVMWAASDKGEADVAQELVNRHLVSQQQVNSLDNDYRKHYYVLL